MIEAECLAACGFPTCVQINSKYYENITPKSVPELLEHLKSLVGEAGSPDGPGENA